MGLPSDPYATELHIAVLSGRIVAVRRYLDRGARVTARDKIDRTPLHWAVALGLEDVAKVLLVNTPPRSLRAVDKYGRTALHYAAASGNVALARVMINRGACVNCEDFRQVTPLHLAAELVDPGMTQLFLGHRSSCAAYDAGGRTPQDYAERVGSAVCARLLAEAESRARAREAERAALAAPVASHSPDAASQAFESPSSGTSQTTPASTVSGSSIRNEASKKPLAMELEECLAAWRRSVRENRAADEKCGSEETGSGTGSEAVTCIGTDAEVTLEGIELSTFGLRASLAKSMPGVAGKNGSRDEGVKASEAGASSQPPSAVAATTITATTASSTVTVTAITTTSAAATAAASVAPAADAWSLLSLLGRFGVDRSVGCVGSVCVGSVSAGSSCGVGSSVDAPRQSDDVTAAASGEQGGVPWRSGGRVIAVGGF